MKTSVDLLVIGAGPFGLAATAAAREHGIDTLVLGDPMGFWRSNMPAGMLLRSGLDWHLDPFDEYTMERYLDERGQTAQEVEPLTREFYLDYVAWFQERRGLAPEPVMVDRLDRAPNDAGFVVTLEDGRAIAARRVVLALGMGPFAHVPDELAALFPPGRGVHTRDAVDFAHLAGRRCLILGGRQSAFEWAALIREAGSSEVHVVHRHPSPAFADADWSWVNPVVDDMAADPGWFRSLSPADQQEYGRRLWAEGRLKVEPWLEARVNRDGVTVWPGSQVVACNESPAGALAVVLDGGAELMVDDVIYATGFKVDLARIPLLANGNLLAQIETRNGFPVLSEQFESSAPGLSITSMAAGQDFGPFFGFTVAARTSAKIIGGALASLNRQGAPERIPAVESWSVPVSI